VAHKKHHHQSHDHEGGHHHTSAQHRGDAMHLHSHPGKDGAVVGDKHAVLPEGHPEMKSIAHGFNPPEHYQRGSDNGGALGGNEHMC
jgi:hypothetical protein